MSGNKPSKDYQPGFSPDAPGDNRIRGEWSSRYEDVESQNAILFEACYLGAVLLISIVSIYLIFAFDTCLSRSLNIFFGGLSGGMLGGSLFSIKWLYHSVAKFIWNRDRRLWRIFTPLLSAGLSLAFLLLVDSNLVSIFSRDSLNSASTCIGLGFLVGYFSDNAVAKLSEVAMTLFGTAKVSNVDSDKK